MKKTRRINNENGSVVVLALIMVVLLSLLGMAVTRTSSIDVQVSSNETRAVQDLYKAESADNYALEDTSNWMTSAFLLANQDTTAASVPGLTLDTDGDSVPDTTYEIRYIKNNVTDIAGMSIPASNDLPVMNHKAPPPPGSGYSLKYFDAPD
jgi:Tfp pilus assembly protein PilX